MSTSLLYHGFGIVGYHYMSQHFQGAYYQKGAVRSGRG